MPRPLAAHCGVPRRIALLGHSTTLRQTAARTNDHSAPASTAEGAGFDKVLLNDHMSWKTIFQSRFTDTKAEASTSERESRTPSGRGCFPASTGTRLASLRARPGAWRTRG
ncbi:hypothetical protein MPLA_670103 [Mesorhizobium sp. ORS 3359]|nr:hypothetical protein MPLA_670103 [Mesorhizobium sp. ORS 3359]